MSAELVHVPVPGADDLLAIQAEGREWAALKPMCETLGIDFATQLRKLRSRSWAVVGQRPITAADGKSYQTAVVDADTIPMWLATIDENRVAEDARPKLIAYQREARQALASYFNQRTSAPALNQLDVLRAALDQIEAAQREAQRARQIAAKTDARLDAIEAKHDWFSALGFARYAGITNTSTTAMNRLGRQAASIRPLAFWAAEMSDRFARWIARDDLGQRLAWADDFDYFQVDRGQMPAPVLHLDDMHARRQARKRHPAGSRRT